MQRGKRFEKREAVPSLCCQLAAEFLACHAHDKNRAPSILTFLLTEHEGCTGEYWPKVVAAWIDHREVRTRTTEGQYFQLRLEQARREGILNVLASAIKNSRLVTVILETVRMAKSPPSKNQSERPIYIYHIMIFLSFPWLGNPPRDVKATPYNDTSIILSWYPPRGHSQGLVSYNNFFGSQIGA